MATALATSGEECKTLCVGPRAYANPLRPDSRTTALLQASVRFLENIGVWAKCAHHAAPLETIRIIDDTGSLFRAPEVVFRSSELGDFPFGYNIGNADLVAAMRGVAADRRGLTLIESPRATITDFDDDAVTLAVSEEQSFRARLIAAADGRRSLCRSAAGITTRSWRYDQTAIACNFGHSRSHENCSNEFHRPAGPFTTVPLPGETSSLVWVERPAEAERLLALDEETFAQEIEHRLHGILGAVDCIGPRAAFPLSGLTPSAFAKRRVMLVGEAAHVIPPIGAQGLNLGFRDAATLAEQVGHAMARNGDPGSKTALDAYDRARRSDVMTRTAAVDLLNRSLLTPLLPVQLLRSTGLHLLKAAAPLRRYVMRQGVAPQAGLPALMQASVTPAAKTTLR